MIEIKNLAFEYSRNGKNPNRVLDNVNVLIKEGEKVALMGANGSGKTTLVRCINGLLQPSKGEVLVDNLSTKDESNLNEIRRRVGMVFQNPENQIVSTTVEREIAFGLENLGIPHQKMHQIVDDMLEKFNLNEYRHHPPHLLSGGEMQRLALAAIVAMSPKYIIFDEPTSLLDPASRQLVLSLISDMHHKENNKTSNTITTLFITQFPEEALSFDRLLVLNNGRIAFDDSPNQIFRKVDELKNLGLNVPAEFEVNHYLKNISKGQISLNTSDFLPIV